MSDPTPKPDLLAQAGELLQEMNRYRFTAGLFESPKDTTIVLASAVLAVAGELRDIHNVLHEINQHMAVLAYGADALPPPADKDLCIWAWSFVGGHWYGACGYQAADEVDATATIDDGSRCPGCGAVIHRISEERVA